MSARKKLADCRDVAPLLVFYACDEVDEQERTQIETHVASCAGCKELLTEAVSMQVAVVASPQCADELDPSGFLLSQCRSELSETLDDLSTPRIERHWMPFGWMRRWMTMHPAWSAASFVLVGLVVGKQVSSWYSASRLGNNDGQAFNVLAAPRLTDEELSKMVVAGVNFAPAADSAPGTLQLQIRAERPMDVRGSVDDADVRRLLTYVVANGGNTDPGVRLDCLDALKARYRDQEVRRALLTAARKDQNAAVRMKALEALRESASDDAVRATVLDALQHDTNPGVRVEAVNLLVRSLETATTDGAEDAGVSAKAIAATSDAPATADDASFERVIRTLEELQRRDPNRYVRLRSAAALRQITPRDLQ